MISSHRAELKAFGMSNAMIAHIRLVHGVPLIAVVARPTTRLIASIVDRAFLKPNRLSANPPAFSITDSNLVLISARTVSRQYPISRVDGKKMAVMEVCFLSEGVPTFVTSTVPGSNLPVNMRRMAFEKRQGHSMLRFQ